MPMEQTSHKQILEDAPTVSAIPSVHDLAHTFRLDEEAKHEGNLEGMNDDCAEMSQRLFDVLEQAGHSPERAMGQYLGADEDYDPDTSEWDEDALENFDREAGFSHWWLEVDGKIVDVCADQFHPSNRDAYRIVIEDVLHADYQKQWDQPEMAKGRLMRGFS